MKTLEERCGSDEDDNEGKFVLDDFIGLYIIMGIFFTLSIAIHFITVHPRFHQLPKDEDPRDLGGSRRLLRKKIVTPGMHKTGPDRFEDAGREIDALSDNQELMNDCLDEILRILDVPLDSGSNQDSHDGMAEGPLEDQLEDPIDSLSYSRDALVVHTEEGKNSESEDHDSASSRGRHHSTTGRRSSLRFEDELDMPAVGPRDKEQAAEAKKGVPLLELSATEPSTSFSSLRTRIPAYKSMFQRLRLSSGAANTTAAASPS